MRYVMVSGELEGRERHHVLGASYAKNSQHSPLHTGPSALLQIIEDGPRTVVRLATQSPPDTRSLAQRAREVGHRIQRVTHSASWSSHEGN